MSDLKVGAGPVLHAVSALSPDEPRGAALGGCAPCCRQAADMQPLDHPVAECAARRQARSRARRDARRDRRARLSRLRHDLGRGARTRGALPLGLAEAARVVRPIKRGRALTYANCAPDDFVVIADATPARQSDARSCRPPNRRGAARAEHGDRASAPREEPDPRAIAAWPTARATRRARDLPPPRRRELAAGAAQDAPHPPLRGERRGSLHARPRARHDASVDRPGGERGRRLRCA